jgi:hypothetical protein
MICFSKFVGSIVGTVKGGIFIWVCGIGDIVNFVCLFCERVDILI